MVGRGLEPIQVQDGFWDRADVIAALRTRNMGTFLALVSRYSGASQTRIGIAVGMAQGQISEIVNGVRRVEKLEIFDRIATGLSIPDDARMHLGLAPKHRAAISIPAPVPRQADAEEGSDVVRRRTLLELTGGAMLAAVLDKPVSTRDRFAVFAEALTRYVSADGITTGPAEDIPKLATAVAAARSRHQACEYASVIQGLPQLLDKLETVIGSTDGDDRLRALALASEAYHVAAGLLLKHGDQGLAWLAADRSMRTAERSGDLLCLGSAARIVTHALLSGGHPGPASAFASTMAARLDSAIRDFKPEALSVYGALLLRGAIAAARRDDHAKALQLVAEADEAAQRIGSDHNHRWTAFGPTNVSLHRVNIGVVLGDAGTAISHARQVDLSKIDVIERKAAFFVDVARAYGQWGKYDRALRALQAADQTAPEEVASRPAVCTLVADLAAHSPRTVRADFRAFAQRIGAVA